MLEKNGGNVLIKLSIITDFRGPSELTPIVFNMELTHLGSKVSYYMKIK